MYPNLDFYVSPMLKLLDLPENMHGVINSVGRSIGWITNWIEMLIESTVKIARPR